jgi:hypothetical protein
MAAPVEGRVRRKTPEALAAEADAWKLTVGGLNQFRTFFVAAVTAFGAPGAIALDVVTLVLHIYVADFFEPHMREVVLGKLAGKLKAAECDALLDSVASGGIIAPGADDGDGGEDDDAVVSAALAEWAADCKVHLPSGTGERRLMSLSKASPSRNSITK